MTLYKQIWFALITLAASLPSSSREVMQTNGVAIYPTSLPFKPIPTIERPPPAMTDSRAINNAILSKIGIGSAINASTPSAKHHATMVDAPTPDGYSFIFGPTNGANGAPGFMGFTLINEYNVASCAQLCNARAADPDGGACQYFNIWLATSPNGTQETTCAFYFIPTDASTATNTGTSEIQISDSRGYARVTLLVDGGFEGWTCDVCCAGHPFCSTESYFAWTITWPDPTNPDSTANIFRLSGAHTGLDFASLGSFNTPPNPGVLHPTVQPLSTVAGHTYSVCFFHQATSENANGTFSSDFQVLWNGRSVFTVPSPVPDWSWRFHQVQVTAVGGDQIGFTDTLQSVFSSDLDDVFLFLDN